MAGRGPLYQDERAAVFVVQDSNRTLRHAHGTLHVLVAVRLLGPVAVLAPVAGLSLHSLWAAGCVHVAGRLTESGRLFHTSPGCLYMRSRKSGGLIAARIP